MLTVEIEGSKFLLSPRIEALKRIRAKLRGDEPALVGPPRRACRDVLATERNVPPAGDFYRRAGATIMLPLFTVGRLGGALRGTPPMLSLHMPAGPGSQFPNVPGSKT